MKRVFSIILLSLLIITFIFSFSVSATSDVANTTKDISSNIETFNKGDIVFLDLSKFPTWLDDFSKIYINFGDEINDTNKLIKIKDYDNVRTLSERGDKLYSYTFTDKDKDVSVFRFYNGSSGKLMNYSISLTKADYDKGNNTVQLTGVNDEGKLTNTNNGWLIFSTVIEALNVGFLQTLKLFFVTLIGAIPLGLIISFGSMSKFKPLAGFVKIIVWIIRGTPLMIQLLIVYYFPGLVLNNNIWGSGESGRFIAAAVAFIFNYACYFSEIFRGGIQGVPIGQNEAGKVLGLSNKQIFFKVTLLQMVKRIVPPMSNEIITLVKDTSLSRIIALQEVIWAGQAFMKGRSGISGAIWPLFFTGIYYLIFSGILTILFNKLEKKLSYFKV